MTRTKTASLITPLQPERVDYDGCYLVSSVGKDGRTFKVYSKGYKLKSWLNFERSLGNQATFQAVTEAEFEKNQWYNIPLEDEPVVKKPVTSATAKKAVKKTTKPKYPRDDGPLTEKQLKQVKKSAKTVAKKPQKKPTKKS